MSWSGILAYVFELDCSCLATTHDLQDISRPTQVDVSYGYSLSLNRLIKPEYNNKNVLLRATVHQISRGESAAAGLTVSPGRGLREGDVVDRIT